MTTVPPTLLADLHRTDDPRQRATQLAAIADAHELAGLPAQARLLRLVAATETMLANPNAEPDDDPAWEDDGWWKLAGATNRARRAEALESIWRDWALPLFGDDADVLLEIAETERATVDDFDTAINAEHVTQIAELDAVFDFEAGLADVYARAGVTMPDAETAVHGDIVCADEPEDASTSESPSTAVRDLVAASAKYVGAGLLMAVPIVLVAAPQSPWQLKVTAGLVVIVMVLAWLIRQLWGPQR